MGSRFFKYSCTTERVNHGDAGAYSVGVNGYPLLEKHTAEKSRGDLLGDRTGNRHRWVG